MGKTIKRKLEMSLTPLVEWAFHDDIQTSHQLWSRMAA